MPWLSSLRSITAGTCFQQDFPTSHPLIPQIGTQLCQTRLCQSSTQLSSGNRSAQAMQEHRQRCGLAGSWHVCLAFLCFPGLGVWNLHGGQAPNPFLTSLKSNVWDQPLLLQL